MKRTEHRYFCDLCEGELHDNIRHDFDKNLVFNHYQGGKRQVIEIGHLCGICELSIIQSINKIKENSKK
jgi:hypothetical protein